MAPLVTLQIDFPREVLVAGLAGEPRRLDPTTQSLENGRPFTLVRMIGPYVPVLILVGGEADRSEVTVDGTREGPVVAVVVRVAILLLVVAQVEEFAQRALALEEVGAIVVFNRVTEPGL